MRGGPGQPACGASAHAPACAAVSDPLPAPLGLHSRPCWGGPCPPGSPWFCVSAVRPPTSSSSGTSRPVSANGRRPLSTLGTRATELCVPAGVRVPTQCTWLWLAPRRTSRESLRLTTGSGPAPCGSPTGRFFPLASAQGRTRRRHSYTRTECWLVWSVCLPRTRLSCVQTLLSPGGAARRPGVSCAQLCGP